MTFDWKNVIDALLIFLAIFEQILSYLPQGWPHSTAQLITFIVMKIWRCFKKPKKNKDIIVLENI